MRFPFGSTVLPCFGASSVTLISLVSSVHMAPVAGSTMSQPINPPPGEEVGMDDLIRIAAQQKMAWFLQRLEHKCQLHRGKALNLIDNDEIVTRRCQPASPAR